MRLRLIMNRLWLLPLLAVIGLVAFSGPVTAAETPTVSLSAEREQVPFGKFSGLSGYVSPSGGQVIVEYWNGSQWQEFLDFDSVQGRFSRHFFTNQSPRDYRARYMGATSETVTITLGNRIEVWDYYNSYIFGQWIKLRGAAGGPTGGWKGKTLHLQKWDKDRWKWVATAKTNDTGSGYYEIWLPVFAGGTFRTATEASVIVSNETQLSGARIEAWQNSKVHGVLSDRQGKRVRGVGVYLQRWEPGKNKWVWEASGKTSSEGYVNFTPKYLSDYRLGTWASRVTSNVVNAEERPELSYLSRWPSDRDPEPDADVEVYALARDQDHKPIEGVRAEFAWRFGSGIYRETVSTNASGLATSSRNIGNASGTVTVYVEVTYRGQTIQKDTSFSAN